MLRQSTYHFSILNSCFIPKNCSFEHFYLCCHAVAFILSQFLFSIPKIHIFHLGFSLQFSDIILNRIAFHNIIISNVVQYTSMYICRAHVLAHVNKIVAALLAISNATLFVNITIKCDRSQSGYTKNENFVFLVPRTLFSVMAVGYFGRYILLWPNICVK